MNTLQTQYRKQSGAALVVALILLVALTLMAISSMNTASLDLIMAGNEQYRQRAFQAAEIGIEQALENDAVFDTSTTTTVTGVSIGSSSDTYAYIVTPVNGGAAMNPPEGSSFGTFDAVYFTIQATGTSVRNATTIHTQEALMVVPASGEYGANDNEDTDGDGDTDSDDVDLDNITP